jgi:hypothetical protein
MAMVDQAMRDPISVGMLKINGSDLMAEVGENPGPRVGWILHALLEEVLEDPQKNTREYLLEKSRILSSMETSALKDMGEAGKDAQNEAEEQELSKIKAKHKVD